MESLSQFLDMGGYGAFVWPSYLATAVIMVWLAVQTRRWIKRNEALVTELEIYRRGGAESAKPDET